MFLVFTVVIHTDTKPQPKPIHESIHKRGRRLCRCLLFFFLVVQVLFSVFCGLKKQKETRLVYERGKDEKREGCFLVE